MLEGDFGAHVLPALNAADRDTRFERQQSGQLEVVNRKQKRTYIVHCASAGAADYVGRAKGGCIIELELKGPRTKTRDSQLSREKHFREWGCPYVRYRYSKKLSLKANIEACVEAVDEAIEEWRASSCGVVNRHHGRRDQ